MLVRPVLQICSERSGSNLLRLIIGAHPLFYAPAPVHLGRELWSELHHYGDVRRDAPWKLLLRHTRLVLEEALLPLEATPSDEELAQLSPRNFAAVYAAIYARALAASGKQRVYLKENHAHRMALHFAVAYPDYRIVFQVRDPRDYLASCKTAGMRYGSVTEAIRVWEDDTRASLRVLAALGAERVFVQRYEDLISQPQAVLPALCSFLGVDFSQDMLGFHATDAAQLASKRKDYWRNLARPLIADNAGKYRRDLSRGEREAVEAQVGDLMRLLGYDSASDQAGPFAFRALSGEQIWRKIVRRVAPQRVGWSRTRAERVRFRKVRLPSERRELGPRLPLPYVTERALRRGWLGD